MNDDKMAKEYNIEGGSVLHLVSVLYCILFTYCTAGVQKVELKDWQLDSIVCCVAGASFAWRTVKHLCMAACKISVQHLSTWYLLGILLHSWLQVSAGFSVALLLLQAGCPVLQRPFDSLSITWEVVPLYTSNMMRLAS